MPVDRGGPIAAIDCGTNSTRLLVFDQEEGDLLRMMHITRLGERVDESSVLAPDAVSRTIETLEEFRRELDRLGVTAVRAVATSAVRDAENGHVFVDAAARVIGTDVQVLSGEEEGHLAFAGATEGLPLAHHVVVLDIGGGSTELIVRRDGALAALSLRLGCVRLTERYLVSDPPTPNEIMAARSAIASELDRAQREVGLLRDLERDPELIGLAGTVSTLSALSQGLIDYDFDRIHHSILTYEVVKKWSATLLEETIANRRRRRGMTSGREDVIAGGALILEEVMARLGAASCLVSERDILDGLVMSIRRPAK